MLSSIAKCVLPFSTAILLTASVNCQTPEAQPEIPANDLGRTVIYNEMKAQEMSTTRWMYEEEREQQGRRKVTEVVQTGQGTLERLLAVDDHLLGPDEQRQEEERIEGLVRNPQEQQKRQQIKRKEAEQCKVFFKMMADAFNFSYHGREGDLIRLSFKPNPKFQAPTREARVLQALEGELWVQATERRLARIQGQLTSEVKFGGGLLGHLDKGGKFSVQQTELAPGEWELTRMEINMQGKALFFKTIAVQEKQVRSKFRRVADDVTLSDAANMLIHHALVAAKLGRPAGQ
jgi:hypothetical protein